MKVYIVQENNKDIIGVFKKKKIAKKVFPNANEKHIVMMKVSKKAKTVVTKG